MNRYYRCVDRVPGVYGQADYRVTPTGEYRPPLAGEWYISGAIPEGYRMPNDGTMPHHIARLCRIERIEVIRELPMTLVGRARMPAMGRNRTIWRLIPLWQR